MVSRICTLLIVSLIVAGMWQVAEASRIYAKAWLAHFLLEDAWHRTLDGETRARPWPWADTWPVAELALPRLEQTQIILAGDSGRTLAFGPGLQEKHQISESASVKVISAHRDTHFNFLKHVVVGDKIELTMPDKKVSYTVVEQGVVDQRFFLSDLTRDDELLLLVTCYPFDTIQAGTDERYVVVATK